MATLQAKIVDDRGRLPIGPSFAGKQFTVQENPDGSILLKPALTISMDEKWLWENQKALSAVMNGVKEAHENNLVKSPRRKQDQAWINDSEDKE